jgi:hypothetical protein
VRSLDGKSVAGSSGNKQNGNDQERRLAAGQPVLMGPARHNEYFRKLFDSKSAPTIYCKKSP